MPYGQPERAYIYSTPDETGKQTRFYMKHQGHPMVFVDEAGFDRLDVQEGDIAEFEEDE